MHITSIKVIAMLSCAHIHIYLSNYNQIRVKNGGRVGVIPGTSTNGAWASSRRVPVTVCCRIQTAQSLFATWLYSSSKAVSTGAWVYKSRYMSRTVAWGRQGSQSCSTAAQCHTGEGSSPAACLNLSRHIVCILQSRSRDTPHSTGSTCV